MGTPELRTTPAGRSVMRMMVECANQPGAFALPVLLTDEDAERLRAKLRNGVRVKVAGSLTQVSRRLKSGILETGFEVKADSIVIEDGEMREN